MHPGLFESRTVSKYKYKKCFCKPCKYYFILRKEKIATNVGMSLSKGSGEDSCEAKVPRFRSIVLIKKLFCCHFIPGIKETFYACLAVEVGW